jgi:thiamine-monophosphate kinase
LRTAVASGSLHAPADLALSCDAFLENIHFLADVHPPDAIGYKALARATSDLAAMGAVPQFFMLSSALPDMRTGKWLDEVLVGMARAARQFGMVLIGGDTSRNVTVAMNITVGGQVAPGRALTRSGARPGDGIFVSGTLGAAQLGLELILRGVYKERRYKPLLQPHLRPQIQLELGRWLAGEHRRPAIASAATDTSDGLSSDLTHICQASGVGARIYAAQIPTVKIPKPFRDGRFDSLEMALHGGEDYQLLFTVPRAEAHRIPRALRSTRITRIGEILKAAANRESRPIELVDASGWKTPLIPRGWDSFRVSQRDS